MSGFDEMKQVADKIKEEVAEKQEEQKKEIVEAKTSLQRVQGNEMLKQLYAASAGIGTENLAASVPLLKIHSTGKSSTNELADGSEPNNGWFFYTKTQEQFQTVNCHIVAISRGYRTEGMADPKTQEKRSVFTTLMAGTIIKEETLMPFYFYLSGKKLQGMWDFGKEASQYTRNKQLQIPLFALTVKLSTVQEKTDYGKTWVLKMDIVKDETGFPVLVDDEKTFKRLLASVERAKQTMDNIIQASEIGGPKEEVLQPLGEDQKSAVIPIPDDLPF